jgi:hypothetical protein
MEAVLKVQDRHLGKKESSDPKIELNARVSPPDSVKSPATGKPAPLEEDDDAIPEEDLAVVKNFDLLQNYDLLKQFDLADSGEDTPQTKVN